MKSYISSEAELGNAIQAIDKSIETLQQDLADSSNVASVFVGRDTRYVRWFVFELYGVFYRQKNVIF